jgi:hypothetical protein
MENIRKQDNKKSWFSFLQKDDDAFVSWGNIALAFSATVLVYLIHGSPYSYFVLLLGLILGALDGIHLQLWKLNNKNKG